MASIPSSWQTHFKLTDCPASTAGTAIPANALGVAVIYTPADSMGGEQTYLVLESRAGSLRDLCVKRLTSAKLPPLDRLVVAFRETPPATPSPESVHAACREQVLIASQLRRDLRPAMR